MNARSRCQLVAVSLLLLTFAMGLGSAKYAFLPQSPAKTIEVLVAKRDLHQYERLTEPTELFTTAVFCAGKEPVGAYTSIEELRGKILRHAVAKGRPVLQQNIYEIEPNPKYFGGGLNVLRIPIEEKNLPVGIDELSGKYLDVVFHYSKPDGSLATAVLAKNAPIVWDSSPHPPMPDKTHLITLGIISHEEVLMIVGAKEMVGTFQLILSNR